MSDEEPAPERQTQWERLTSGEPPTPRERPTPTEQRRLPRRWWLFRLFDVIVEWWPEPRDRQGVLLVRMDGIGDMVMFHAAWRANLEFFSQHGPVTILGCLSWASVAPRLFPGAEHLAIDEHKFDRNPFYRLSVCLALKRRGYAIAICDSYLRKPLVADSLVHASEAPIRIVARPYSSPKTEMMFAWSLAQCGRVIDTGEYPTHEINRHFKFLSALANVTYKPRAPRLPWPSPERSAHAVINVGGNEPGRRWPPALFLDLARVLGELGMPVVVVGGPEDRGLKPYVAQLAQSLPIEDRIGQTTLPQLMDLIGSAALLVSSDTGPAHLGLALGTPSVVLVGGGHFGSFVPYPTGLAPANARFLWHPMPCYHCFWNCIQPHKPGEAFPCVAQIDPEDVRRACLELLGMTS